jgi:predicted O-methyltransferase YrrM
MLYKAEILYYLTRITAPDIVVETGVNAGLSSTFLLEAMKDNNKGHLFSLDLPPVPGKYGRSYPETFGKSSGWIVPQELRRNWTLEVGSSREKLPNMLGRLEHIDLFFHDSLHTYKNQMFEYVTAWRFLGPCSLLVSDDIGLAFFEFARMKNQQHGTFRETGVIKKR